MCDMSGCDAPATHFVVVESQGVTPVTTNRLEVCEADHDLGLKLRDAGMAIIANHGPLSGPVGSVPS